MSQGAIASDSLAVSQATVITWVRMHGLRPY